MTGDADAGVGASFLTEHLAELSALADESASGLAGGAERYARWVRETLEGGGKLLFAGNGGSSAHAEHVAAEYRIRYRRRRRPLAALSLSGESAALTAGANDFGYREVFARAVEALGRPGDLLVLHSTSGDSPSVLRAAEAASERGIRTVGLTGRGGGALADRVDLLLAVPSEDTARIQEIHLVLEHAVADRVDRWFADDAGDADDVEAPDDVEATDVADQRKGEA